MSRGLSWGRSRTWGAVAVLTIGLSATLAVPAGASLPGDLAHRPAAFSTTAGLPPELTQDLVAYYPFDETAGTVVKDRSGNARDATIVNGNTGTVWNNGRGLTLPGGNGGTLPAVKLPDSLLAGLSNVTIAFEVRLSSTTQQGQAFAFGRTADNAGYLALTPGAGTARQQALLAGPGTN